MKTKTIIAATLVALSLSACGNDERDQLEDAWSNELTTEERASVCMGWVMFPNMVTEEINDSGLDEDTVRDFLADKCGEVE